MNFSFSSTFIWCHEAWFSFCTDSNWTNVTYWERFCISGSVVHWSMLCVRWREEREVFLVVQAQKKQKSQFQQSCTVLLVSLQQVHHGNKNICASVSWAECAAKLIQWPHFKMTDVYNSEGYSAKYQKYRPEYPTGVFQFFARSLQEKVGVRDGWERNKERK